jgi:uncharacterized protein (TIGR03086 family)
MTTNTSPQTTDIDPRTAITGALHGVAPVIGAVRHDQLSSPTPCTEYDVRAILGHLVGVANNLAAVGRGESPPGEFAPAVADDGWPAAWAEAAAGVRAAWEDPAQLAKTFDFGWATMTGAEALAVYTSEFVLHTWDLAQGTGQRPTWDDDTVLRPALAALQAALPDQGRAERFEEARRNAPPEWNDFPDPFAAASDPGPGAPLIDQLVAWSGRKL